MCVRYISYGCWQVQRIRLILFFISKNSSTEEDSDGDSAGLEPSACRSTNTRKVFGQINSGGEGCAGRVPADATASYPPPQTQAGVRGGRRPGRVRAASRGSKGPGVGTFEPRAPAADRSMLSLYFDVV